ncbi:MAG: TetR/AcrR family transcriptional regulator [Peptococcaceae bacterium]|jgi:AcrR family transcriptional regulator|nr:TetR/AcrR family transcriptional regulator [Peptococcaceae bacterium]MDH7524165.1 TetR/AcrR family transcriptional regulator [Peptococcaceae bacterium]
MSKLPGEERRRSIIQAARLAFSETGFRGTSIKDIAKRAGVSTALLYAYFENKEALYDAVLHSTYDEVSPTRAEMEALGPGTEALVLCVYDFLHSVLFVEKRRHAAEKKAFNKLLFRSMIGDTKFAYQHHQNLEKYLADDFIVSCFRAGYQAGEIIELPIAPKNLIQLTIQVAMGLTLSHLSGKPIFDFDIPKRQLFEHAVLYCLRGIGLTSEAIEKYYQPKKLQAVVKRLHKLD